MISDSGWVPQRSPPRVMREETVNGVRATAASAREMEGSYWPKSSLLFVTTCLSQWCPALYIKAFFFALVDLCFG